MKPEASQIQSCQQASETLLQAYQTFAATYGPFPAQQAILDAMAAWNDEFGEGITFQ
jgi:hypothetical protein